ncbi:MAG: substrate-binding domain-containing protein [Candidatus Thiodiazotropha sp. (ex Ctena orbiculata)]|uniref:Substrate-binding domain-containing protein n=1 Tax=Candidatus Thiodiazotropha taylori TaxID=2792791 RepID=A0A944MAJ6_9GAMM|nr:substrate-binding domain-containing protein [Candidatus Thiodiazotropha taylori]MBT3025703.1 substrate-binding domain-containing protein [Candidatus Thiodiazotropha taylori]MBT3033824.1 substrate-binding domain-containing protein [Candidatus Thiodiazotropha taylori]MBV2135508.1 substrate-binding domain-containing protein [Candidatus Thiodiazotropha taylori]PVV16389.1 MAG: ABC transporter substrate-binding protein [gamma proteobacterium symbiont of Ctena orbiculata]
MSQSEKSQDRVVPDSATDMQRRQFLKSSAAAGALTITGAPFIGNAVAAETTTWKIQTSWPGGIGLEVFKDWCNGIVEKTGGELAFKPFGAKDVVGEFQLFDAVKNGVLDAMNPFTLYWAGRMPVAVFLSSYPLGLRNPHEWDTFYYGLGGLELAREAFGKMGLHFVGPIHHGPNIIHSKVPIRSIDDFRGRKMRLPGGMVAEVFQAAGAKTTLLPGSEIFPALEKGTIDVADYVGPAINHALGFHQVTKYISMGPPGFMSIYQPVDLMDLTVSQKSWGKLSANMKQFVEMEVHTYSDLHHAAIQAADQKAWKKFEEAGTEVTRLSEDDVEAFTLLSVPLWYKWANKDAFAAKAFQIQLEYMMSGSLGYVDKEMIKGHSLKA